MKKTKNMHFLYDFVWEPSQGSEIEGRCQRKKCEKDENNRGFPRNFVHRDFAPVFTPSIYIYKTKSMHFLTILYGSPFKEVR